MQILEKVIVVLLFIFALSTTWLLAWGVSSPSAFNVACLLSAVYLAGCLYLTLV